MKTTPLTLFLAFIAMAAAAQAEPRSFASLDTNSDGALTRAEFKAGAMNGDKIFARIDLDTNGALSPAELALARAKIKGKVNAATKQFDTDGDGKLSADEKAAAKTAMVAKRSGRKADIKAHIADKRDQHVEAAEARRAEKGSAIAERKAAIEARRAERRETIAGRQADRKTK